jgi:undecaprenyl-diphosphatase
VLFFDKLNPFGKSKSSDEKNKILSLWTKVLVGVVPAGVIGVLFDDWFDEHFYNFIVVAIALIVYGVGFIIVEKLKGDKEPRIDSVYDLTYKDALIIGCYQTLSLIPGTSRSGSTILGGMLTGVSRTAAAEFSFFMAIPIMLAASLLKILKFVLEGLSISSFELILLFIGIGVSFAVSLVAIEFLMNFVKKHNFKPFGIYRIVLGIIVVGYFLIKTIA